MKRFFSILLIILTLCSMVCCTRTTDDAARGATWNPDSSIENDPWMIQGTGSEGAVTVSSAKIALNPLTGESNMPEDRVGKRPIAVSVNNIIAALPQYGISAADYILEIETEGGITRLMCLYSDTREIEKIGSLRSLRDQFIEALFVIDPLIVHFGTSVYADAVLLRYNMRMLDAMIITPACWTDTARVTTGYASEHTKFTGGAAIEKGISSASINPDTKSTDMAFNFLDEKAPKRVPSEGKADSLHYYFFNSNSYSYDGDFRYNASTGKYQKWQHDKPHIDAGNDKQLEFDNVIVLFADIDLIPGQDKLLVKVDYDKGGTGYYFSQGHYESFKWSKSDFMSNFSFIGADGNELDINVGKTHMGIIRNSYKDSFEIMP
ncbi:MAG: DUF3048 domain-containing protein [Oscillospiraceae bacterium]|nr:DUF3048 domain-containing protein [Oscillospiraceae bacterium]